MSLADKLHNARAILFDLRAGRDVFARFNAPREDQAWYYDALATTFAERAPGPMARSCGGWWTRSSGPRADQAQPAQRPTTGKWLRSGSKPRALRTASRTDSSAAPSSVTMAPHDSHAR